MWRPSSITFCERKESTNFQNFLISPDSSKLCRNGIMPEIYEWPKCLISVWLNKFYSTKVFLSFLCFACGELWNVAETRLLHFLFHRTKITISGFGEVQINIKYLCDCECTSAAQKNSSECSTNGTFECAICKCNDGFFGDNCQCDQQSSVNPSNTLQSCLSNPNDNTTICSNQGKCVCGQCVCNKEKVGLSMFSQFFWSWITRKIFSIFAKLV